MSEAEKYVQYRDGNWYVGGGRVEVYSVVAAWQQGYTPEEIRNGFPHLSLAEIYGTILHYLEHQSEMEAFFRQGDAQAAQQRAEAESARPEFFAMMRERIARYQAEHQPSAAS
ncbi:MAG: hypothetical protein OJF49_001636 [Ktedonobacterales bacterium]|nr:MAG: hypothetical protein OJF49_001636 [Ktedonobacterales bacterium]